MLEAPPLSGVMNKRAGYTAYSYSRALKRSNLIWTEENIFLFLGKPKKVIPGNQMHYPGIKNRQDRADIIAYLKTLIPN